jgi:hypothetical protein
MGDDAEQPRPRVATRGEREIGTKRLQQAIAARRNAIMAWQQSALREDSVTWAQQRVQEFEALIASRTARAVAPQVSAHI